MLLRRECPRHPSAKGKEVLARWHKGLHPKLYKDWPAELADELVVEPPGDETSGSD